MKIDLKNYNIFIAGGLGEIGKYLAKEFLRSNAKVVILYYSNNQIPYNPYITFKIKQIKHK